MSEAASDASFGGYIEVLFAVAIDAFVEIVEGPAVGLVVGTPPDLPIGVLVLQGGDLLLQVTFRRLDETEFAIFYVGDPNWLFAAVRDSNILIVVLASHAHLPGLRPALVRRAYLVGAVILPCPVCCSVTSCLIGNSTGVCACRVVGTCSAVGG